MNNIPQYVQDQGDAAVKNFIEKFPVFKTPLDTVLEFADTVEVTRGQPIPDGTIKPCDNGRRYAGYIGGKVVTRSVTLEGVKDAMRDKFGITELHVHETVEA